ncbi:Histidine kinase-, DNA gyrase B-, and HSP90-like ATPase [Niabella drilacis]|uniref:histidine kinase n=1 Tax=Niabella drilacis (strain DSM 25811 / CCM 8410 / CCUG 62505 / LMG 26954 / E90) TaxID=1285928 RepID=A0A1G7AHE6_NIADE|nr:Histidine kinase-, DNA gyrase B-, and HSP90-like ATPase [Niabella drilacis]
MNKKRTGLLLQILLLLFLTAVIAWCCVRREWWWGVACFPLWFYVLTRIIGSAEKTDKIILEFVEAVKYNDFSKNYNTASASGDMKKLLAGLNSINDRFKTVNKERKAENIYLQTILELTGIGILSFDHTTGLIRWMNEAFKKMTDIPYFKNIQALEKRNPEFLKLLLNMETGQTNVFTFKKGMLDEKLLIGATLFATDGRTDKLISLQSIKGTLDETESVAWQKLLNVMTHEIMNSVAPISSLADTLKNQLEPREPDAGPAPIDPEDLKLGLETIRKRSEGLQRFAITYRNLNKITKPVFKKVLVSDIFENLQNLMQPTLDQKHIELDVILKDPFLSVQADVSLIEQVLINLMTNAIEAVRMQATPQITLSAFSEGDRPYIKIADNGVGIPSNIADQIFIPFFSTRKNGNGIGLSLCKQIMILHKGSIQVKSKEGEGTVFLLYF